MVRRGVAAGASAAAAPARPERDRFLLEVRHRGTTYPVGRVSLGPARSAAADAALALARIDERDRELNEQLDELTQQNAALVEQASAATESLQQQAATQVALVGENRIDGAQPAAGKPGAAPLALAAH